MPWEDRKLVLEAIRYVDEVISFNDTDGTACDAIEQIAKRYNLKSRRRKIRVAFGNGGDRTQENVPEQDICKKLNMEMIWELGGGKIESSSKLLKKYMCQIND